MQARSAGAGAANARATGLLAQAVRTQANVQSYMDGFLLVALVMLSALFLVALPSPAPHGPASPLPLRRLKRVLGS